MFDELPEDEYTEVPTPEHLETVFQGTLDTVAGNEGLTYAQHYLHSCLQTSGIISNRTGTEGFFGTIGNGIKAAWEYIKKMFASIWNFFFGKDAKEEKTKVQKEVKTAKETVDAVEHPKVTASNVKAVVKAVEAKAERLPDSPKKKELEKKIEEIKEEPNPSKMVSEAVIVVKDQFNISILTDAERLQKSSDAIKKAVETLRESIDKRKEQIKDGGYSDEATTIFRGLVKETELLVKEFDNFDHTVTNIKDVSSAKAWIVKGEACIATTAHVRDRIQSVYETVKNKMDAVNVKLRDGNADHKDDEKLEDELFDLSCSLNATSFAIQFIRSIWLAIGIISRRLEVAGVGSQVFE